MNSEYNQYNPKRFEKPTNIPFSGWKSVVIGVKDQINLDNVSIVSAGVAFFGFLAIFPAIAALVSIYGLAMDPQSIQQQLEQMSSVMPEQALNIIETQLETLVSTSGSALGWSMALGLLFTLWSANKGIKSLFTGVDIAYNTRNDRGLIKQNALTLLFTLAAIILVIVSMAVIVVFPVIVGYLGLPSGVETLINYGRWFVLAAIVVFFLAFIYRYAPAKKSPKLKWVMPGALLATFLWLLASWGFSFYVKNFGNYGEVYGSISAVVVLLLWLFLTSFIILLGAELNSEIEKYASYRTEKK